METLTENTDVTEDSERCGPYSSLFLRRIMEVVSCLPSKLRCTGLKSSIEMDNPLVLFFDVDICGQG